MKALSGIHSVGEGGIKRGPIMVAMMTGFFMLSPCHSGQYHSFPEIELHLGYGAVILHSSAFAAQDLLPACSELAYPSIRSSPGPLAWCIRYAGGAALLCVASAAWFSIGSCALMGASGGLIWIVVTAVLSELHGDRRNVALAEASAVAYAFGTVAPLVTSLCLSLALSWRYAVVVGVVFGGIILLCLVEHPLPDSAVISTLATRACLPLDLLVRTHHGDRD